MFATTTVSALTASIGEVSSPVFTALTPYLLIAVGLGVAFYVIKKVIALMPKR